MKSACSEGGGIFSPQDSENAFIRYGKYLNIIKYAAGDVFSVQRIRAALYFIGVLFSPPDYVDK